MKYDNAVNCIAICRLPDIFIYLISLNKLQKQFAASLAGAKWLFAGRVFTKFVFSLWFLLKTCQSFAYRSVEYIVVIFCHFYVLFNHWTLECQGLAIQVEVAKWTRFQPCRPSIVITIIGGPYPITEHSFGFIRCHTV